MGKNYYKHALPVPWGLSVMLGANSCIVPLMCVTGHARLVAGYTLSMWLFPHLAVQPSGVLVGVVHGSLGQG